MFGIENDEKTLVLIDGANMYATVRALGFDVDFKKLEMQLSNTCNLFRTIYYTALLEENEHIVLKPLIDWLAYNNYTLVTKPAKVMTNSEGVRKVKGNMDIEIAVDAILLSSKVGNIVIFTGDGDFCPLIRALQMNGNFVVIVSSTQTQPSICADELRKQADRFIELGELKQYLAKPVREFVEKHNEENVS